MTAPDPRLIETNGIRLRIAETGTGPLVLLLHGWPESWYSWRHQLPALAEAGYHAVAPDMRGYGGSDAPANAEDYDILDIAGDVIGLIDALGERQAVVVGHDWGAIIAWQLALLHPDRVRAVVGMSVPYTGRAPQPPTELWRRRFGDNFFYILYFQEPGVAEAEFDADPAGLLRRLYRATGDTGSAPPLITDPKRAAGGMIGRTPEPSGLPPWLSQADLDYYVGEFTRAGFRGGINYYRNFDRNWELTPHLAGQPVTVPALFIAGEQDMVITRLEPNFQDRMRALVPDLRGIVLLPGAGHWVQQERPEEVNAALRDFLRGLDG